jgi:hypothetical protein
VGRRSPERVRIQIDGASCTHWCPTPNSANTLYVIEVFLQRQLRQIFGLSHYKAPWDNLFSFFHNWGRNDEAQWQV